jgi:hypothetical protein
LFYSSVAGVTVSAAELLFQLLLEPLFQLLLFSTARASVASASLSEPLSESPSTIAAVTKDKIYRLI